MPTSGGQYSCRLVIASWVSVVVAAGCLADPAGLRSLALTVMSPGDSLWVGAPGERLPAPLRVRVTDERGAPVSGARVTWTPSGVGAYVVEADSVTGASGLAQAGWVLGTNAADSQYLRITVTSLGREGAGVGRARAVPHVVAHFRFLSDTPAVVHVGDSLVAHVGALDPYGNAFETPQVELESADTGRATCVRSSIIGGPGRGRTWVRMVSQNVRDSFPLQVVQQVATIEPGSPVLLFTSLGAEQTLQYNVLDDHGQVVQDSAVTLSIADTTIASFDGQHVRSLAPGRTVIDLSLGQTTAATIVQVQQISASLTLVPDTIRLTALHDTGSVGIVAHDSLGSVIAHPDVTVAVTDSTVGRIVDGQTIEALGPGTTQVRVTDTLSGRTAEATVLVQPAVARAGIDVRRSNGFTFAARGDSVGAIWVEDHNGYRIGLSTLNVQVALSDSSRAAVDVAGVVRALGSGITTIHVVLDSLTLNDSVTVVAPVQVEASADPDFSVAGLPDSLGVWAPTAIRMPDGSTRLFFTGYVYDSIQRPPFSGSLHYATSPDGVHFTYVGVALPRDSGYSGFRSQGVENVFMLPRDDGPGCRMLAAAGSSWWIWQIYSAVSTDCTNWAWEDGPALPGVIEGDTIGRPIGEGMYVWQDSTGALWMLTGAYPATPGDVRTWTVGLYRGSDQRHWQFVRTVLYPGPAGSGRERSVGAPSVAEVAPGLYRMFLNGDDLGLGPNGGRARIWSAVSRDRFTWVLEGVVLDLGIPGAGPRYPTVIGNQLYYVHYGPGLGAHLSVARIQQP